MSKHRAERQSIRDARTRKSKGRQQHAAEYRSWSDRPRFVSKRPPRPLQFGLAQASFAAGLLGNPGMMERLFGPEMTDERAYNQRNYGGLMDRLDALHLAQGTSGSAQDPQGLEPKGAGPVAESDAP